MNTTTTNTADAVVEIENDSGSVTDERLVDSMIARTFGQGLETWDREEEEPINLGGAKLWSVLNWKDPTKQKTGARVAFHYEELRQVLQGCPAQFFQIHQAVRDESGEFELVERTNGQAGHRREQRGFMLYLTINTPKSCQSWLERFQEVLGAENVDSLANHAQALLACGAAETINGQVCLKGARTRVQGIMTPMKLSACIYFGLTSGGDSGESVWGFVSREGTPVAASSVEDPSNAHVPV